jgi:outer membrane immunogenic protein
MKYKVALMSPLGLLPAGMVPAVAADMPLKAVQTAKFDPAWAGFYAGVNLGVIADQSSQSTFVPTTAFTNYCWLSDCTFSNKQKSTGILGGLQIGYNFQSGKIVYGVEADIDLSSARKTVNGTYLAPFGFMGPSTAQTGVRALGTARLRIGYAFDRSLVYATGGLAYAKMANAYQGGPTFSNETAGWRTGYALGGGWEYSLTQNWSVKAEGLYYDLGRKDYVSIAPGGLFSAAAISERMTGVVGRLGVNYFFH